jgi:hypothetical protein
MHAQHSSTPVQCTGTLPTVARDAIVHILDICMRELSHPRRKVATVTAAQPGDGTEKPLHAFSRDGGLAHYGWRAVASTGTDNMARGPVAADTAYTAAQWVAHS